MARFVPVKTKFVSYIENDFSKSEQNDKFLSFLPRDLVHTHTDVISTYIGWSVALANFDSARVARRILDRHKTPCKLDQETQRSHIGVEWQGTGQQLVVVLGNDFG